MYAYLRRMKGLNAAYCGFERSCILGHFFSLFFSYQETFRLLSLTLPFDYQTFLTHLTVIK